MKEHLAAAGVRPLIESNGDIGAERDCAGRLFDAQSEQARPRRRCGDRAGDAGRAVDLCHIGIHRGTTDLSAHFIACHHGGDEVAPADTPVLRQRQQGRQHHDAKMADTARVHVLTHEAMSHHGIRERRVAAGK